MNLTGKALVILMTFVLGFAVVACGSDSDSDSASSSGDAAAIEGIDWKLMNIFGDSYATSLPKGTPVPTINFDDGTVEVFTGCNNGTGEAEIGESTITLSPIAMTKKGCEQTVTQIESLVSNVLKGEVTYELNDEALTLSRGKEGLVYTQG